MWIGSNQRERVIKFYKMEPANQQLQEKAIALRNLYQREWYRKHPGKHSEYQNRYWLKKAAKLLSSPASCLPENQAAIKVSE